MFNKQGLLYVFEKNISKNADKDAFIHLEQSTSKRALTYEELHHKSQVVAAYLQQHAKAGDRVLLSYSPGLDFIVAFLGCLYTGVIAVPAYPLRSNHHTKRFLLMLEDCQPSLVCGTRDSLKLMQQQEEFSSYQYLFTEEITESTGNIYIPPIMTSTTLAFLQYTSGSTGAPKGVMVNHGNIMANLQAIHHYLRFTSKDTRVSWLPMQHDMGLIGGLLYALYTGITEVFLSPATFLANPFFWIKNISDYQAYSAGGPNFGYELCVNKLEEDQLQLLDLSCWKVAYNGSEPIRKQTLDAFSEKFKRCGFKKEAFLPCYGMAETTLLVSGKPYKTCYVTDRIEKSIFVSSGHVYKDYQLKIVNPNTLIECSGGELGEIWINGPSVSKGYWNKGQANQETFQAHLADEDRDYLRTGDLGFLKQQELYIAGRLKDLIILQGRNIYPQDVEQAVESCHVAIRKGCVAAFSAEINQQEQLVVVAEIERVHRKMDFAAVFQAIRKAVIDAVEVIPYSIQLLAPAQTLKTTSGKIQRKATQQAYIKGALVTLAREELLPGGITGLSTKHEGELALLLQSTSQELRAGVLKAHLERLLKETLNLPSSTTISSDQGFFEIGMDSLRLMEFQNKIQYHFGNATTLTNALIFDCSNIDHLGDYLLSMLNVRTEQIMNLPSINETPTLHTRVIPLNFKQMILWFWGKRIWHTISFAIEIQFFETEAINQACKNIIVTHPGLWLFFDSKNPLLHFVAIKNDWSCKLVDVSQSRNTERVIERLYQKHSNANPWMRHGPPMLECFLIKKGDLSHVLHVHVSHAVFDAFSVGAFVSELHAQLEGTGALPVQMGEFNNQFLYDARYASELQSIEEQNQRLSSIAWQKLPVQRTWKGYLFPEDIAVPLNPELQERIKKIHKKLNITFRELVFALCMMSLQDLYSTDNLLIAVVMSQRDKTNEKQFGFMADTKHCILAQAEANTLERLLLFIQSFRNSIPANSAKAMHLTYSQKKMGIAYRILKRYFRHFLFKESAQYYYPEQAEDDYSKALALATVSELGLKATRLGIFSKTINKIIIYNDLTFEKKSISRGTISFEKATIGISRRKVNKIHSRLMIHAYADSGVIEFVFRNWEGRKIILSQLFVTQYEELINRLEQQLAMQKSS